MDLALGLVNRGVWISEKRQVNYLDMMRTLLEFFGKTTRNRRRLSHFASARASFLQFVKRNARVEHDPRPPRGNLDTVSPNLISSLPDFDSHRL